MEEQAKSRLHPLVATAAVGVILLCLVAVAAMTGYLPGSNAQKADQQPTAMAPEQAQPQRAPSRAATPPAQHRTQVASAPHMAQAPQCPNCGVVSDVKEVDVKGEGSGVGAVAGGVAGALVGNQFGHGTGNTIMTVAGAVGGGLAGNEIEKRAKTHKRFDVAVRMPDGSMQTVSYNEPPSWRAGDRVRVVNGQIQPL